MKRFVVIDLETTGNSPATGDRIIEIGIVVIENDKIVNDYAVLLHPNKPIPFFIENLTGIRDIDVQDAPLFAEKAAEITAYLHDAYLVAHNVPFDVGFLNHELKRTGLEKLDNPVIDTVELCRILFPKSKSYNLGQLAQELNLVHRKPHRALSDAYVTAELLLKLLHKINSLPIETIQHLLRLETFFHSDLFQVLENRRKQLLFSTPKKDEKIASYRGVAFKQIGHIKVENQFDLPSFGDFLDRLYEHDGTMQQNMQHYDYRSGQREMSEAVFDAFIRNKHASIEAGTGIGKTLAYLIPAIYVALSDNTRVIISTHTTQLQSQLMDNEIPLLKKLLANHFHVSLLKGKQHYISLERFQQELISNEYDNYDIALTKAKILVWLTETETGDSDEIQLPASGYRFYRRVSAETETKTNQNSSVRWSYYQLAKRNAENAHIILTNHALLCTDIFNDHPYIPAYKKVIIDEAHHLEEVIVKHSGLKLDYISIQHSINLIHQSVQKLPVQQFSKEIWSSTLNNVKYELDDLFRSLYYLAMKKNKKSYSDVGRVQVRLEHIEADQWRNIMEKVNRLLLFLHDTLRLLKSYDVDQGGHDELTHIKTMVKQYIEKLEQFFGKDTPATVVRWMETDLHGAKNAVYLFSEPINASELLTDTFFHKKHSVVLTSATLTMKNSFDYIHSRLGLDSKITLCKQISSPFPYDKQVQLLIPNDFPIVTQGKSDEFIYSVCEAILSLAAVTKGRMLVLFTSYDMLRKAYDILKESMHESSSYELLAQGITSGSRNRLTKNFKIYDRPILLGTSSFWEGIDIPGELLACLVMVRLPFQVPTHPVYQAKANELKQRGKNPFTELALPHAVLRFKQGFGRLIRSPKDRGIIFVCDARVMSSRYGKLFLQSIPNVPTMYRSTYELINQAEKWFHQ